ncbi:hypothetical protein HGM15179_008457 [Zosterops borbonicus]|uniref:Uncharacterized protein n=1 Tax=Zosterops borbonicus TaxID=364589 RepID=A0A8K1GGW6_9PASS|nr:hypothetical protein HGM15179_008457 [Zosterops borbonicus]
MAAPGLPGLLGLALPLLLLLLLAGPALPAGPPAPRSKCFMMDNQTIRVYAYIPDMPDGKVDEANVVKRATTVTTDWYHMENF